eukprot:TRINITY_DN1326_c1_g1_i1.p1 TRINITY_DN1326_c1_g1~~TRINITY_DN1326_c1_g1_i1.p1  ORF type:complete len:191 (+),score=-22.14 TRINITY_DN1326_c1_g1_i1:111-683(+)
MASAATTDMFIIYNTRKLLCIIQDFIQQLSDVSAQQIFDAKQCSHFEKYQECHKMLQNSILIRFFIQFYIFPLKNRTVFNNLIILFIIFVICKYFIQNIILLQSIHLQKYYLYKIYDNCVYNQFFNFVCIYLARRLLITSNKVLITLQCQKRSHFECQFCHSEDLQILHCFIINHIVSQDSKLFTTYYET